MLGGRSTKANHLHFRTRPKRRFPLGLLVTVVALVAVLAVAAVVRAETESPPALEIRRQLAGSVTLPGSAPRPAWPAQGEAAVEVQGFPPLGSSGPGRPVPIASVAKVMTAYVVLRDHPVSGNQTGFSYTVTAADAADYRSRLAGAQSVVAVAAGETLDEVQLLEALLVPSGNNIAAILADYDAGSQAAFVAKMNSAAASLGMTQTTYTDASGLQTTTVSTASDQLKLASRVMADPVFARIVSMTAVDLPVAGSLANFNTAVGTNGFVGIKTGSDSISGGCLMFADRQTGTSRPVTILGVVLGQDTGRTQTSVLTGAALSAATTLVQSVRSAVAERVAVPAGTTVAQVVDGAGHRVAVKTAQDLTVVGLGGQTVSLAVTASGRALGHSLAAGQTVAAVSVASSAGSGGTPVPARAAGPMPSVSLTWRLEHDL